MRDATIYGDTLAAEASPRRFWTAPVPFRTDAPTAGDPVAAYVNAGRWIVECPDCHSAQLTAPTDRRFMCSECANAVNGGAWRPVKWPRNADAIAAVLEARPEPNQNWSQGETLAALKAENAAWMRA